MVIKATAIAVAALLLLGCDDDKSDKEASMCKGLNEADCRTKSECVWNAEKSKCKPKKDDEKPETTNPASPGTEQPAAPQNPPQP
jgi:hypothetical protein